MKQLKEIKLDEIKKIELDLLVELDRICREQGFRYFMVGGTLIGAVRHKGFIPWDDDIDISMPRPDYELFLDYCIKNRDTVNFDVISNKNYKKYWHLFSKLSDRNSIIKDDVIDDNGIRSGVSIDVFPIDGLGKNFKEAKRVFYAKEFQRELLDAKNWKKYTRSKTRSIIIEPVRLFFFVISRFCSPKSLMKNIENYYKNKDFDTEAFSADVAGVYRTKEIMEKRIYSEYCDLEFEGHMFRAPKYYDEFLTNIYGDYMKLPPKEKQVSHHTYRAYRK